MGKPLAEGRKTGGKREQVNCAGKKTDVKKKKKPRTKTVTVRGEGKTVQGKRSFGGLQPGGNSVKEQQRKEKTKSQNDHGVARGKTDCTLRRRVVP